MAALINLTNKRFGRLVAVSVAGRSKTRYVTWNCICDCGSNVIVRSNSLIQGKTKSCGCYKRDFPPRKRHGMSNSSEHNTWQGMKARCYNPKASNYHNYGGRGIEVCDKWKHSFDAFIADMGPRPSSDYSLDRINVNGPYSPENCRWATVREQRHNKQVDALKAQLARYEKLYGPLP